MRTLFKRAIIGLTLTLAVMAVQSPAMAAEKTAFRIAWSIYAGWMPWGYAADSGIMKKWADKYGISVEIVQINDYVESINQYTAGAFDGCVMTNMDALTIPSAGGVDSTALISGDYSDGNDGVVLKGTKSLKEIKGQNVNLVELSVSHYLLARALDSIGMSERDVRVVNTADADIVSAFVSPDVTATVTWNPQLSEVRKAEGAAMVFDSSKVPGEIIDLMVVNTEALKKSPALGKALVGAWYETLALMKDSGPKGAEALNAMATASGTDLEGYKAQLATTRLFYTPPEAVAFATSPDLVKGMDLVRNFSFDHGLLGEGARTVEAVGIEFPGGKVLGDARNVKLRFDVDTMKAAAEGKL